MSSPDTRMTSLDTMALKLYMARDGTVWFADGIHAPIGSGLMIDQFVDSLRGRQRPFIRILGTPSNATLIISVWPLCQADGKLQVASPAICENSAERADPEIALYRMRQVCLPPSLGGWHDFARHDYSSYALVARIRADNGVSQHAREILHHHPVWPCLQFVQGLAERWTAWVLCFVVDPRWFVDLEFPDRVGRLQSFLGLRWSVQQLASEKGRMVDRPVLVRCKAVLSAWKGRMPQGSQWKDPRNFLWRIWRSAGKGVRGDLVASQKFIVFLRYTWLDALYNDTTSSGREPLFLPDMLFKTPCEIEAFERHIQQHRNLV